MSATTLRSFHQAYLVRTVEQELLRLFAAGKLSGTTHTCIGQEMSAVALSAALDKRRDVIFSNHRCHGHYLAWTDDVDGLVAEIMGKDSGVCGGLGGSQHLCADGFFSNGIQGGIAPVAAGLAFAQKLARAGGVVAVCIGDGTLGEGVVYETLNIAARWRLPLLVLLENNSYAQSTSQAETLAGDICARAAAFGIPTFHGNTWEHGELRAEVCRAVEMVRHECAPAFIRVDTYRLAAHSKGDDDRDAGEISEYSRRDPLNKFLADANVATDSALCAIRARVALAIEKAERAPLHSLARGGCLVSNGDVDEVPVVMTESITQLEAINRALGKWLAEDPTAILLGEDIRAPYGGAFKATRRLSDSFPDRVINTPISEAGIVGVANGLALGGRRPVVEIMFGDFLGLAFDQLLNHAAKFRGMYNRRVENPVVVRAPMGGGRGYGPTHSQNIEKHFAGIPGLRVLVLHGRTRIAGMYQALRRVSDPTLVIENKLLYRESCDAPLPPGYALLETSCDFPTTILRPETSADLTVVAFGRMSKLAEQIATRLAEEDEISAELLFPLCVSPFDAESVNQAIARTGKLLVVEEGAEGFDLASEVIAAATSAYRGTHRLHVRRVAARAVPIPSALALEQQVLPNASVLHAACLELFDE